MRLVIMDEIQTMNSVERIARETAYPDPLTTQNILELYEVTQDELRICGCLNPTFNSTDVHLDIKENTLLELEEDLLNAAARVELRGNEDLKNLIDLWKKTFCQENDDNVRPTDRIAMNIFRYLMSADGLKD